MNNIQFWNGNKSTIRAQYEPEVFEACLAITKEQYSSETADFDVVIDNSDHPAATDESNVFFNGADALVTVAGNPKFAEREKIVIENVIDKGLLGFRGLICSEVNIPHLQMCQSKQALQAHKVGIPATWVDAELFRSNGFTVVEKGLLDDLFPRLTAGQFDFTSLGMNEIEAILKQCKHNSKALSIVPQIMIFYALPLVFYVHPQKEDLARRLTVGLIQIMENGQLDAIFEKHYGKIVQRMAMKNRRVIQLTNPFLQGAFNQYQSDLI